MEKDTLIIIEAFFNYKDIDQTIESLVGIKSLYKTPEVVPYDIIILENPSKYSNEMEKIIKKYSEFIKFHYISNENIEGNIFHYFVNNHIEIIKNYKFIAMTEGDVILSEYAFDEAYKLINKYPLVGNVSIDLSLINLNIPPLPISAHGWIPPAVDGGDCLIGSTGFQFILFKRDHLLEFIDNLNNKKLVNKIALGVGDFYGLSDSNLTIFNEYKKAPWIRTKYNKLIHIGWDHYKDPNDEYWKYKNELISKHKLRINFDLTNVILYQVIN